MQTHTHTHTRNHMHILLPCVENEAEGTGPTESWLAVQRRRRQDRGAIYHTTAHSTKTQREARAIYIVHLRRRQNELQFYGLSCWVGAGWPRWRFIEKQLVGKNGADSQATESYQTPLNGAGNGCLRKKRACHWRSTASDILFEIPLLSRRDDNVDDTDTNDPLPPSDRPWKAGGTCEAILSGWEFL